MKKCRLYFPLPMANQSALWNLPSHGPFIKAIEGDPSFKQALARILQEERPHIS